MRALLLLALLLPGSAFAASPDSLAVPAADVSEIAAQMIAARHDEDALRKLVPHFQAALVEAARAAETAAEVEAGDIYAAIDQAVGDLQKVFPYSLTPEQATKLHGQQLAFIREKEAKGLITLEAAVEATDFCIFHYTRLVPRLLGQPPAEPALGSGCMQSYLDCVTAAYESYTDCLEFASDWTGCYDSYVDVIGDCADSRDSCVGS